MTKKEIIDLVKSIGYNIKDENKKDFFSENEEKGIGSNQFHELASICHTAECYDEIELLIKYNIAKTGYSNNSWAKKFGNKRFGDIVIEKMEIIKEKEENDKVMESLELFFGYLYWQAKIWSKS